MRRFLAASLVVLAFVAAFSQKQTVVVYAYGSEMITLDPSTEFSNSIIVLNNVYETLTRYVDGKLEPLLATEWSANEDGTMWTFKLRKNVKFHDGTELTSEAVKFSIERTIRLAGGPAYIWDSVQEIETPDPYTVVFKLKYPANIPLIASAGYGAFIFSPKVAQIGDDEAVAKWFNAGNDAGTGPYTISKYDPKTQVVLRKFDGYWRGWTERKFDIAVIQIVPDPSLRMQMVTSGKIHITRELIYDDLKKLENNPNVYIAQKPSFQVLYLFFNTKKFPFNNPDFRAAVAYAIPYKEIIDHVLLGYGLQPSGIIPKGMFGYADHLPLLSQDLEKAKQLLAKSNVDPKNVKLVLTYLQSNESEKKASELIRASLKKLGIEVELRPMNWEQQWAWARSDPSKAQDMFIMYWWPTVMTPYDFLFSMFHSEEEVLFNLSYYYSEEVDKLMDEAVQLEGTNPKRAEQLYKMVETILRRDLPAVPLYQISDIYVVHKSIKGFTSNPAYPNVVFFYEIESGS
jgi:peptide/nickel transport system substrate-binding protein